VIAFTHGTVGVATNCSPSLQGPDALGVYEGLDELLAAGYVLAAIDYQGLGTPGPHPCLVGRAEGMNALDSVRAAHELAQAHAGTDLPCGATPKASKPRCSPGSSPPATPPSEPHGDRRSSCVMAVEREAHIVKGLRLDHEVV